MSAGGTAAGAATAQRIHLEPRLFIQRRRGVEADRASHLRLLVDEANSFPACWHCRSANIVRCALRVLAVDLSVAVVIASIGAVFFAQSAAGAARRRTRATAGARAAARRRTATRACRTARRGAAACTRAAARRRTATGARSRSGAS